MVQSYTKFGIKVKDKAEVLSINNFTSASHWNDSHFPFYCELKYNFLSWIFFIILKTYT